MSAPLLPHSLYRIELCSGEQRCWRYRGEDAQGNRWWRDEESDQEFNEASLMYAWQVLGPAPDDLPASIHRLLAEQMDAALILADKSDVHRSRVRNQDFATFDIHDRVNYAVEHSFLRVNGDTRTITMELTIDIEICPVMEYFEIFLSRMVLCRRAADFLKSHFALEINGAKLL